jgi:hypothetical protein
LLKYLFADPIKIFKDPTFNIKFRAFECCKTLFFDILEIHFLSCVIIDYNLYVLYKTIKIKAYRNIIFRFVLYGREISYFHLSEGLQYMLCENIVLRRVFGLKGLEVTGNKENYLVRSLVT